MKSKSSYLITVFSFVALLCAVSCTQEEILEPQNEKATFAMVGDPVRVHLSIAVGGLTFGVATRAEEPVPYDGGDSEEERHIDDLWVFEYDASTGELVNTPEQIKITDQSELNDVPATLANNNGSPVIIYVVANSGSGVEEDSEGWVVEETVGTEISYPGFMTIEDLEANTIPTPHPQRMTWDENKETYVLDTQDANSVSIPMGGYSDSVTVSDNSKITVPVSRMFAKLLVRVDLSSFNETDYDDAWLNTVTVGNIPEYCTVKALGTSTTITPADYSACPRWLRRVFNSVGESSGGGTGGTGTGDDAVYPYLIYVPENIQGENYSGSGNKAENLPNAYALSVTAGIYVEKDGTTMGEYTTFVAYPGGNTTDNFNVRRNCLYRVTLKINDLIDDVLPSANCIICFSGETTAFFPYCREEIGGGYDFEDYLYAYSEGEAGYDSEKKGQKIDHVGIIWQSTDGGNTVDYDENATGYIGDNTEGTLVWIDDLTKGEAIDEYHRRIHVTIPEGSTGNALIGAYNSNGDIVWSWHIWTRERANDPTTVNTKLYYTYEWDSDGIYADRPRVAGYTIMNCNLGAMQDEPSGSVYATTGSGGGTTGYNNAKPTFGTLYQWGRKDPFPPVTEHLATTGYGGPGIAIDTYSTTSVGNYFDNENNAVTIVGTNTPEALFHSVEGTERKEFDVMIPLAIQNPTVFYASTQSVNYGYTSYVDNNLASYMAEPKDGNWILDSDADHFNRLWGGLDPENDMDQITKSYDTGITCNLGDTSDIPIYIYDDYGEKSIFDPCPYGWRVSPPDQWLGFTIDGLNAGSSLNNANYNTNNTLSNFPGMTLYLTAWREGETSFFPCQGTRAPDGSAFRSGQCGNYNNATADANDRVNTLHIHFNATLFNVFEYDIMPYYLKSTAGPLRCTRIDSVQQ